MIRLTELEIARFWAKIDKNGPMHPRLGTRCWLWIGAKKRQGGHGMLTLRQLKLMATHVAWLLEYGQWPTNEACHHCDVPSCVRPEHLFDGTHLENMRDANAKNRLPKGSSAPWAKITETDALAIRASDEPFKLGRRLGIHRRTVKSILWRASWKHV